jgi:hypothetical protein
MSVTITRKIHYELSGLEEVSGNFELIKCRSLYYRDLDHILNLRGDMTCDEATTSNPPNNPPNNFKKEA